MSIIHKLVFSSLFFLCVFFNAKNSLAIETRSNREAIIAPRTKKFYKGSRAKQYLSLTGNYSSDNNSRNYQATSRYLYQSNNFIHELNFDHEVKYADVGSGKKKQFDIKRSRLIRVLQTENISLGENAYVSTKPKHEYQALKSTS